MLGDSMYLENIEEYVQDENRIVTFKWLSRTLSVPVNAAKRMLYEYVEKGKPSQRDSISVIYLVSGFKDGQDGGLQRQEITLVEDKYLEDAKSQFSSVWTVHVYSVQRAMPKDSESLYTADYQSNKDHLSRYQHWNTIDCLVEERADRGKTSVRTDRDCLENSPPAARVTTQRDKEKTQSKASRQIFPSSKASKKKPPSTGGVASFLSKAKSSSSHLGSLGSSVTQAKPIPVVQPVQEAVIAQRGSPSKQAQPIAKQSPTKRSKPDKSPSKSVFKLFRDTNVSDKQDGKEEGAVSCPTEADTEQQNVDQLKRATATKSGGPRQRQMKRERTNADGQSRNGKRGGGQKRRRVRHTFSDDDEESDQEGGVEPAEENSTRTVPREADKLGPSGRRRKRVKKLVSKMYMDEDGSMVTEKHWEDVSTDASSDGERDAGATSHHTPPSATTTSTVSHGSKTTTCHLASKGTKQSSLMSFFGK